MNDIDEVRLLSELREELGVAVNTFEREGLRHPLAVRTGTIDEWILKNIFEHEEYAMPLDGFQPKLIIDCGANVGYSAVYFANKYPDAKIIAVEPEDSNFKMLTYNAHFYDNISCLHSAIWNKSTRIKVVENNNTTDCTTIETKASDPHSIESTTILKLFNDSGADEIDLLKVDIEGAEREVFADDNVKKWLPKVKVIAIELHDWMKRGCSYAFFKAISKYKYYFSHRGENLIFIRESAITRYA